MKYLKNKFSGFFTFLIVALFCVVSCQNKPDQEYALSDNIPEITPTQNISITQIDSLYFGYLGINSISLPDGDFALTLWEPSKLIKLNADISEIKAITNNGRGPGEMLFAGLPTKNSENLISTFDQFQNKVLVFDENLQIVDEYLPKAYEDFRVSRVFNLSNEQVVFEMRSTKPFIVGEEKFKLVALYDPDEETYRTSKQLFTKPYAPLGELIGNTAGSAMAVPYSDDQFIELHPQRNTLFLFDTRTEIIAEVDANFDTLNAIPVNLPIEKLSQPEKDTLKANLPIEDWEAVESYLPEYKAVAGYMKLSENHIWLASNLHADFTKWFVLNMKGEIEQVVNLPKNSMLTHISNQHLGVRLDDATFGLFEPVVLD